MKKKFFILCAALVWTVALMAQSIAVVKADGSTTLVRTLDEAIAVVNENDGCVVYLPGGGFSVSGDSKITKKVTIIGIGHKSKNDNVDGVTTISGNIYFNEGSDESAIMGCYLTGNVNVGHDGNEVNDLLARYCNVSSFVVCNPQCKGTVVNQCYIRAGANFSKSEGEFTHNITAFVKDLCRGTIAYNIFTDRMRSNPYEYQYYAILDCDDSSITNNVILNWSDGPHRGNNCQVSHNMAANDWGEDPISVGSVDWNEVFVKPDGANSTSNYHFEEAYSQYESQVGIYAGDGFNDAQIAPVPYIVAKRIDEQTDASGMLSVKIRVKAGGEEE